MSAFNLFPAKPVLVLGIAPVQDLAFDLVELNEFYTGPALRRAKVTLDGTSSLHMEV